jgi:anti-anti-sigma regulatory factor
MANWSHGSRFAAVITRPSDIRHTHSTAEWSLGAVLAQREIDERTVVVVIRADVGLGPSLTFERRLLGLRLAGFTTIVVDVGAADRVADVMVATLMRCRRKLAPRDARLVIAADDPRVRRYLERVGLEVADDDFDDR